MTTSMHSGRYIIIIQEVGTVLQYLGDFVEKGRRLIDLTNQIL